MTRSTWTPTRFYPEGTARMTGARVMVHVHGTDRSGSVELDELTAHLAEGRQWLLDNERGRLP